MLILTGKGQDATLGRILREVSDAAPAGERLVPGSPTGLWPQSLGETLRLLRHRARISRDDLAQRAGVSAGAISNYENDVSMPPALTLRRVCAALGIALGSPTAHLWDEIGLLLDRVDEQPRRAPQ